jgi:hypothetical protein
MSTQEFEPTEPKAESHPIGFEPDQMPDETPEPSKEPSNEPTEELVEQSKYQTDRLGQMLLLVVLLSGATLLMLALLIILQKLRSPPPLFFKASQAAQLIDETPLDQPGMNVNVLFNWLVEGMINSHSFNFVNYATKLEAAKEYFTSEGYDSFTLALQDNKVPDRVITRKYVFRALPTAAPQIIKEGVLANHYLWKIKLPMTFQFLNATESLYDLADLTLLVVRVPTTQSALGIKILRYELILRKGGYT